MQVALGTLLTALVVAVVVAALEPFVRSPQLPPLPTPRPFSTPTSTLPFPPTPTPRPLPSPTPSPTPPPWDRPPLQYRLEATLDFYTQRLQVQQELRYLNVTGRPLSELPLVLDPARIPDAFTMYSVRMEERTLSYRFEGHRLVVQFPQPLPTGQAVELILTYSLDLPRLQGRFDPQSARILGYTSRQTNLVDWYALVPPYHPQQGWMLRTPWYHGEHLVYPLADFWVRLAVENPPPALQVVSNAESLPCPTPPSSPLTRCYQLRQGRQVVFSLSPYYQQIQTRNNRGILLEGFFFLAEVEYGRDVLQASVEALDIFTELFGPYHRKRLVIVQADFPEESTHDGLLWLSSRWFDLYNQDRASFLITMVVHQLAHQWWSIQVGNDPAREPWLDEALATYAEALYYEHQYPEDLAWWWTYRVNYYNPQGPVNGAIYAYPTSRAYREGVYLRGALFLEDLRSVLGDAAFFTFLQHYRERFLGRISSGAAFFQLLAETAPKGDWRKVVTTYFDEEP